MSNIHLNRFRNLTEASPDSRIAVKKDGKSLQVQKSTFSNRLVQFFSSKASLSRSNNETALAFYEALKSEYGESIAKYALKGLKGYQIQKSGLSFQGSQSITPQTIKAAIQTASALKQGLTERPSVLNLGWKKPEPYFDIAKAESIFSEPKIGRNWKNAQTQLLKSRPEDLKLLIQYRQYVVDSLVQEIKRSHPGFKSQSVGSTALTSDYDITFKPENSESGIDNVANTAVAAFNKRFKEIFSQESGVVFDTNVYAHNYETGQVFQGKKNLLASALKEDQHVAALLKLRKGISADEWLKLQDQSLASLGAKGGSEQEKAQLLKRFEEADAIYALGVSHTLEELTKNPDVKPIHVPIEELSPQAQALLKSLEGKPAYQEVLVQFTGPIALEKIEHSNPDAVLQVRNRLYETALAELTTITERLRANPNSKELHAAQQHHISLSLFYAAEAYHTEGAISHVVGAIQGKGVIELDSNQLAFSILEQIGDAQLHAHGASGSSADAKWVSGAAKYLGRVFDAIERLSSKNQPETTQQFGAQLHNILLGEKNPWRSKLTPGDAVLLLNLLGQSVKRNAIDIKDEAFAKQVKTLLDKTDERILPTEVRAEIHAALEAFSHAKANGAPYLPYEIQNTAYAVKAESGLTELFQANNPELSSLTSRKDALTSHVQQEVINAYVPVELGDLRRYFQALPTTQIFG